jgi:hypothetical protein
MINDPKETFFNFYITQREDNRWDFKTEFLLESKSQIAEFIRDSIAFANLGGGHILFGVDNDLKLIHCSKEYDLADIHNKIKNYISYDFNFELSYFSYDDLGIIKRLGILSIRHSNSVVVVEKDFHDENGKHILRTGTIYIRKGTKSEIANHSNVREILDRIMKKEGVNPDSLINEKSLHLSLINKEKEYIDYDLAVAHLSNKFELNANDIGKKLKAVWNEYSKTNKHEFAQLIGVDILEIDIIFAGQKFPPLSSLIVCLKLFNLPTDFFFKSIFFPSTGYHFFPPSDDFKLIYTVVNLCKPKRHFYSIPNKFYSLVGLILTKVAWYIHNFYEFFQKDMIKHGNDRGRSEFSKVYNLFYKIIEICNSIDDEKIRSRKVLLGEKIIEYFAKSSMFDLSRVVSEVIESIDIQNDSNPVIIFRFDLKALDIEKFNKLVGDKDFVYNFDTLQMELR